MIKVNIYSCAGSFDWHIILKKPLESVCNIWGTLESKEGFTTPEEAILDVQNVLEFLGINLAKVTYHTKESQDKPEVTK